MSNKIRNIILIGSNALFVALGVIYIIASIKYFSAINGYVGEHFVVTYLSSTAITFLICGIFVICAPIVGIYQLYGKKNLRETFNYLFCGAALTSIAQGATSIESGLYQARLAGEYTEGSAVTIVVGAFMLVAATLFIISLFNKIGFNAKKVLRIVGSLIADIIFILATIGLTTSKDVDVLTIISVIVGLVVFIACTVLLFFQKKDKNIPTITVTEK